MLPIILGRSVILKPFTWSAGIVSLLSRRVPKYRSYFEVQTVSA